MATSVIYLILVYHEQTEVELQLLRQVIEGAMHQQLPPHTEFQIQILVSESTPEVTKHVIFEYITESPTSPIIVFYPDVLGKDAATVEFFYNQLQCDVVFFNGADDPPRKDRVLQQLQSFEIYPNASMSLAGFYYKDSRTQTFNWFQDTPQGLNVGYPSGWAFRKSKLPTIEWGKIQAEYPCQYDAIFLLQLMHNHHELVSVQMPLFTYNQREGNMTNTKFKGEKGVAEWIRYQAFVKQLGSWDALKYVFQPRRIMIVGFMADWYEGHLLATEFEKHHVETIRIAADTWPKVHCKCDYHIIEDMPNAAQKYRVMNWLQRYNMKALIDRYQPDWLLVMQNDIPLDFTGVDFTTLPTIYYAHEIVWKRWPYGLEPQIFLSAYHSGIHGHRNIHTYEMKHVRETAYLPYAWSPEQFPEALPNQVRDIDFGFMGTWSGNAPIHAACEDDVEMDYTEQHIRNLRDHFISVCLQWKHCKLIDDSDYALPDGYGLTVAPKGLDTEYTAFMHRCNLALNVAGRMGANNQRQLHVLGMGCVLVQFHYKGIETEGFFGLEKVVNNLVDPDGGTVESYMWTLGPKTNCLLFRDEKELLEMLFWAHKSPDQLEIVRSRGIQLARYNTYAQRMLNILSRFQHMEETLKIPMVTADPLCVIEGRLKPAWTFVNGFLTETEGNKLKELAKGKTIIEIGSFEGRSTVAMAEGGAAWIWAIDPFTLGYYDTKNHAHHTETSLHLTRFLHHTDPYRSIIHPLIMTSKDAFEKMEFNGGVDLIFIDGDHTEAGVKADLKYAGAWIKDHGIIALHDWHDELGYGVKVAARKQFHRDPDEIIGTLALYKL